MNTYAAALLVLVATAATASSNQGVDLHARGDGFAKLAIQSDSLPGVLTVHASFNYDSPVKDSTEAHSHSRGFQGEIRIDGKPCSDAHGRVAARDGNATSQAATSCSVGVPGDRTIVVEGIVTKADGIDREDVRVELQAFKSTR